MVDNYIFILNLTPGFNGLSEDNCKRIQETFKFWDLVRLILEVLRYQQFPRKKLIIHAIRSTWFTRNAVEVGACMGIYPVLLFVLRICLTVPLYIHMPHMALFSGAIHTAFLARQCHGYSNVNCIVWSSFSMGFYERCIYARCHYCDATMISGVIFHGMCADQRTIEDFVARSRYLREG